MRLDGALEPHHGAPCVGSSSGVKKHRDKQCVEFNCFDDFVSTLGNSAHETYNNKNNNNNCRNNNYNKENNCNKHSNKIDWDLKCSRCGLTAGNSYNNSNNNNHGCSIRHNIRDVASTELQQLNSKLATKSGNKLYRADFYPNNLSSNLQDKTDNNHNSSTNSGGKSANDTNSATITTNQLSVVNGNRYNIAVTKTTTMAAARAANNAGAAAVANEADMAPNSADAAATDANADASANAASAAAAISVSAVTKAYRRLHSCVAGKMARLQQSSITMSSALISSAPPIFSTSRFHGLFLLCLLSAILLLPTCVRCDDSDFFSVNSFSPEATSTEFDYASRGKKKFGDKCENTLECGFPGSICDPKKKSCQCTEDLPVTNHIDKCGKEAAVNESCFFNEQCEVKYFQTECRDGRCVCRFEMTPIWLKDGSVECKGRQDKRSPETYIDPAMIGVLVGMALMFIIICVVLRLFSQARWRENRTIFNTPNPRLMNVSLLRDSKLLHGQERRGSRMSVRAPSRQPSMASLRPHSPNPSLGSRSGSHGSGNSAASATSLRSTRSNSVAPGNVNMNSQPERKGPAYPRDGGHPQHQHQQPQITNIIPNPVADSVTVEIIEPEK